MKRRIEVYDFDTYEFTNDYIYIIGNAYNEEFTEVQKIIRNNYEYYFYHEYISTIKTFSIAVSGTHGKTTTTKFLTDLLYKEPISYIIGDGTGLGNKDNTYFIYEACEYKNHFLSYHPDILLITNIDYDHPDFYSSIDDVKKSFEKARSNANKVITINKDEYKILNENDKGFVVSFQNEIYIFPMPGIKYLEDYLLCVKTLKYLGYSHNYIKEATNNISLPLRRTTEKKINNSIIIEDFAHHPTEINALLLYIKQKYPEYKTICFFQPHTYSRTKKLFSEFKTAFNESDMTILYKTYPARESKNMGYDAEKLYQGIKNDNKVEYFDEKEKMINRIRNLSQNFDVILVLGAGDINIIAKKIIK